VFVRPAFCSKLSSRSGIGCRAKTSGVRTPREGAHRDGRAPPLVPGGDALSWRGQTVPAIESSACGNPLPRHAFARLEPHLPPHRGPPAPALRRVARVKGSSSSADATDARMRSSSPHRSRLWRGREDLFALGGDAGILQLTGFRSSRRTGALRECSLPWARTMSW
jgi:hypothetical protein